MQKNKIIVLVVIGLVIAGVSFWGGEKFGSSKSSPSQFGGNFNPSVFNGGQNSNGRTTGMRNSVGASGGLVSGEVLSVDSKSITVKLRDGGSKIVFFSQSAKVEKTVDGLVSDVVVGKQVMITGTANTDGSVNATSIQIRPTIVNSDTPVKQ